MIRSCPDSHSIASTKDLADSYLRLLDAFVYGRWDLAGHELDIRADRQVFNWSKSTLSLTFNRAPVDPSIA